MDVFVEQIVIKPVDGKTKALKVLIGIAAAIVTLLSLFAIILTGIALLIFLAAGAVYGAYWLITNFDAEYEYIVTNGEMDVDKIIAKRKRKRLITAKAASFERFGKFEDAPEAGSGVTIVRAAGISENETEVWYADFTHGSAGEVRLIFSPEPKVIEGLKPFLKRNLRVEFDRKYRDQE